MKLPVIKQLVENQSLEILRSAEASLCEGEVPTIEIEGEDEGEQLTHVLAAIDILERVENDQVDVRTAFRAFSERVRNSIS